MDHMARLEHLGAVKSRSAPVEDTAPPVLRDYQSLIERAVSALATNTSESREVLYNNARAALLSQMRERTPRPSDSEIQREQRALAAAIHRVEDNFTGDTTPASQFPGGPLLSPAKRDEAVKSSASLIGRFLSVQLVPTDERLPDFQSDDDFSPDELRDAFSSLMTNKLAAGYVFGFHDSYLQRMTLINRSDPDAGFRLIKSIYQINFGDQAGLALFNMSVNSQDDPTFHRGRENGGTEIAKFLELHIPPLGLGRILILGLES